MVTIVHVENLTPPLFYMKLFFLQLIFFQLQRIKVKYIHLSIRKTFLQLILDAL